VADLSTSIGADTRQFASSHGLDIDRDCPGEPNRAKMNQLVGIVATDDVCQPDGAGQPQLFLRDPAALADGLLDFIEDLLLGHSVPRE
jgi:hypothetical protein